MAWDWAPTARIVARYVIGAIGGTALSDAIVSDPDLMNMLTIGISATASYTVEKIYTYAKKRGWAT